MYLSNIQSIPEIQACYASLFDRFSFYQQQPEELKAMVEQLFTQVTSWKIAKYRFAVYPTPYTAELMGQGFKTQKLLKKPFISLEEEARRGYNSYGFCGDDLLFDINPLQEDGSDILACYVHQKDVITNFGIQFRHFDVQGNRLTFPKKNKNSSFEVTGMKDFFWLSDTMQASVSINSGLGYYTNVFVYDANKQLQYVVRSVHYHESVRKQNLGRERAEFVSILNYDEQGKLLDIHYVASQ